MFQNLGNKNLRKNFTDSSCIHQSITSAFAFVLLRYAGKEVIESRMFEIRYSTFQDLRSTKSEAEVEIERKINAETLKK